MHARLGSLLRSFLVCAVALAASTTAADVAAAREDGVARVQTSPDASDWQGSRDAMPGAYAWLDDVTPADTYTIVVVRGLHGRAVLRALGGVEQKLAEKTPQGADGYGFSHMHHYTYPRIAQVQRRGHAWVVYAPGGVLSDAALARLSRGRLAAEFFTDVELDTYVTVAKRGRVVRSFDAMFRPPKEGALPAENGLDWGRRHQNVFATAWAFNERLTLTHVSHRWFDTKHPTYLLKKGAL